MGKIVAFGEIMMRLSTEAGSRFTQAGGFSVNYGGCEANVLASLSHMGCDTKFISGLPLNPIGGSCINALKSHGVDTSSIKRLDKRMGLYFLETGSGPRGSQVVYDRADSAFSNLKPGTIDWDKELHGATWFHWSGVSPAVSQNAADITKEAVFAASKRAGVVISVDLNYRDKLWKYGKSPLEIMPELVEKCHVLIGNEGHNKYMLDIEPVNGLGKTDPNDLYEACHRVTDRFPSIHTVGLALRENFSASHNRLSGVLYNRGKLHSSSVYDIDPMIDRIGGGDAFMAGVIYGTQNWYTDPQKVIDYAVGASVLKHSIKGDANIVTVEEVENFIKSNGKGHVSR